MKQDQIEAEIIAARERLAKNLSELEYAMSPAGIADRGKDFAKKVFMIRLSVNINKIATLRNARGGNIPDVLKAAIDCERYGAQGITVHPRPDERHITRKDVEQIRPIITTEFNIEGNPFHQLMDFVRTYRPHQVTFVPDSEGQFTSDHGWQFPQDAERLKPLIAECKALGV